MVLYNKCFGPSVDDQAVSLSDDGTTIIIDFFSSFSLFSFFLFSTAITVLPERVVGLTSLVMADSNSRRKKLKTKILALYQNILVETFL